MLEGRGVKKMYRSIKLIKKIEKESYNNVNHNSQSILEPRTVLCLKKKHSTPADPGS